MSKNKRNNRYRLKADEEALLMQYRGIKEASDKSGLNVEDVKHGWLKNDNASLFFKNPNYKDEYEKGLSEVRKELVSWVKSQPKPFYKKNKQKGEHLLMIDPADVHIGKLCRSFETGTDYNSQIAVKRVKEGVNGILNNASGWSNEKIIFVGGNDILHIDTPRRTTTSGTPQDTDGMWYDNFMIAAELYKDVISTLAEIAPVHFVYNPSNHDYTNGFFLAQLIESYFSNDKRITFDVSIKHRKYTKYYNNLIGTTHGDRDWETK